MANKIICFDKIRKRFVYAYHVSEDGAAHNKSNTTCIGCIGVDLLLPNDILKEINYWMLLFEQCNSRFNKLMDKSQTPCPTGDRDCEELKKGLEEILEMSDSENYDLKIINNKAKQLLNKHP